MSSFEVRIKQEHDAIAVYLPKSDPKCITSKELLAFPAFRTWLSTLQESLARQTQANHTFNTCPYALQDINIQAVDRFGGSRVGFVKLTATIKNSQGEKLPGSIFLRGGSVAMLVILQPDDVPASSETDKQVILTVQPRIPAGSLGMTEIPAGMLDDSGTFSGAAAKELKDEVDLEILEDELVDMTALACSPQGGEDQESLQAAVYPSPGGSDEFIPIFLCTKRVKRASLNQWTGKLTGLRDHGEKITLKLVRLEDLWREGVRDAKTLASWALYEGLRKDGRL
ncbi:MAG: hypothetical protein M1828_000952 [Chrysothrix sp. TS-e1954]|nr:MAG: hypothetical protein M1828_000952 [Chrysothrix sp. TS-e1954]